MKAARALAWFAALSIVACTDDGGEDGGGTETEGTDSTSGPPPSSGPNTLDGTGVDSTGEPPPGDDALVPCDPRQADVCAEGVCAGAPQAGFYCRPACSEMAEEGTACGADDVCLPVGLGSGLACFDINDCDVLTGDGCDVAAGESCVAVSLEPLRTACVPSGTTGSGMACEPAGMHECDVGLACLGSDIEGDDPGTCTALCIPGAALPSGCALCIPLNDEIGTCSECSVIDDQCRDGSQCQPINEFLGGVCVPAGPGGSGDPCNPIDPATSCMLGYLCLETDVDDVFACIETCDPNMPMCAGGISCLDFGVIVPGAPSGEIGVCIDTGVVFCDPDAEPTGCPDGRDCVALDPSVGICGAPCDPTAGEAACEPNATCFPALDGAPFTSAFLEGNGVCGAECTTDADCGGGTCLLLEGIDVAGICGTTCDPVTAAECGAGEDCVATPADPGVGACVLGAMPCDPMVPGMCPPEAAACIALDGGGAATCVPACYEQDPAACGVGPTACHVRTDPAWHGGICIGGGEECDPIAQDCGPMQTCDVIGGGPLGGTALICGDAGDLPEGGDCSADDDACGPGLACVDGLCRPHCDPAADDCVVGTCTDLSALAYLPPGTVGVCL